MKPSSAIALVSAMLGLRCSAASALEMASLLAAQQTSKTATPAATKAPLCNRLLILFIDPMECPSHRLQSDSLVNCQIVLRSDIVPWYNGVDGSWTHPGRDSATFPRSVS